MTKRFSPSLYPDSFVSGSPSEARSGERGFARNASAFSRMRRMALLAVGVLVLVLAFTGCSKSDAPLTQGVPEWASEVTIAEWTNQVVDEFNEGNYNAITSQLEDGTMTAEQLKEQCAPAFERLGQFEALGEAQIFTGESLGRPYTCVIQQATYEDGDAEFRLSFFEDGRLAGFYFLPSDAAQEVGEGLDAESGEATETAEAVDGGADDDSDEASDVSEQVQGETDDPTA